MKCPFCGKSNPDKATICEECGSPLNAQNDIVDIVEAEKTKGEKAVESAVEKVTDVTVESADETKKAAKKKSSEGFSKITKSVGDFFTKKLPEFFTKDLKNIGNKEYVKAHLSHYITAGVTLLVIAGAIVGIVLATGGGGRVAPVEGDPHAVSDIDGKYVDVNGKSVELEDGVREIKQAGDGTVAYSTDDGKLKIYDKDGNLIVLSDSLYQYSITPGGLILFLSDETVYNGENVCSLSYYNKESGEIILIAQNVVKYSSIASYDSKSLAYTQVNDKGFELFLVKDLATLSATSVDTSATGITAQSLSNGGSLLIYEKTADSKQILCTFDNGKKEEIAGFEMVYDEEAEAYIFNAASIYLNEVGTEAFVLYYASDDMNDTYAYYKKAGSKTIDLSEYGSTPKFVAPKFADSAIYTVQTRSALASYYPISTFNSVVFTVNNGDYNNAYVYFPGGSSANLIAEDVSEACLTADMNTFSYIYGNELTFVSLSGGKVGAPNVLVEDAVVFDFNSNASTIYYINYMMELYKITNYGAPQLVTDGINNMICKTDNAGNSVLYYSSYDQDTGKGVLVLRTGGNTTTIASDVHFADCNETLGTIRYYKNVSGSYGAYNGDLYSYTNGKETLVSEGNYFA